MNLRRKLLVNHPLQIKYLSVIVAAMLVPTLVMGFCLYHMVFYLLANEMVFPEAIASNLVPVIDRVNAIMAVTLPLVVAVIFWMGLTLSHRIVGPISRIERELDKIIGGDFRHQIRLRKNDDLADIANKINSITAKLG